MQIRKLNKRAIADVTDIKFWGIGGALWIVVLIMLWKFSIGSETDTTKLKVMFSIISLPVIFGITYLMGQEG